MKILVEDELRRAMNRVFKKLQKLLADSDYEAIKMVLTNV